MSFTYASFVNVLLTLYSVQEIAGSENFLKRWKIYVDGKYFQN